MKTYTSLKFEINGKPLKTVDTTSIKVPINKNSFDTITYSFLSRKNEIVKDQFICKLKENETYTISPCTCCGIFLMLPSTNAKRGFVKFSNLSQQEYIAMVSEFGYDTIPKRMKTEYIFSSISMNCGFRPSNISVADLNYLNPKYQYENWSEKNAEEQKLLDKEMDSLVIYNISYLFLHEEKLTLKINETGDHFELYLDK